MQRIFTRPDWRFMFGVTFTSGLLLLLSVILWNAAVIDKTPPVGKMKGEVVSITRRADGSRLMVVRWTGVRQRHCLGQSERWLVDGITFNLPSSIHPPRDDEPIGMPIEHKVAVDIPAAFPAHRGFYQIRMTYQCNLVQVQFPNLLSVVVTPPPVPFDLTGEVP